MPTLSDYVRAAQGMQNWTPTAQEVQATQAANAEAQRRRQDQLFRQMALAAQPKCRLPECKAKADPFRAAEGYCEQHWDNLLSWTRPLR